MPIFSKEKGGRRQLTKLERRIASISTPELVTWAENSLYVVGKEVTGWLRTKDPLLIDEALVGAEALHAVVRELQFRAKEAQ
jgi:hypothetical protein